MPRARPLAAILAHRRWSTADARSVFSVLDSSGLSVAAFAARWSVRAQRLYCWRRKFAAEPRAAEPSPKFIEIRPRAPEPVEIVLRCGRLLRVSETISTSALERLVHVLESVSSC